MRSKRKVKMNFQLNNLEDVRLKILPSIPINPPFYEGITYDRPNYWETKMQRQTMSIQQQWHCINST